MKVLIMFPAILAVATAQWGYPYYGYAPNTAIQNSNANSGAGGTSVATGTANANMGGYGVPLLRGKRSPDPQYYPYPYYGNYAPNTASQTSNANSGAGGTSIASGTANANMGGYGPLRGKRSPQFYPPYPYYGSFAPNTALQTSNANSGFLGTSIASGTANANRFYRDV